VDQAAADWLLMDTCSGMLKSPPRGITVRPHVVPSRTTRAQTTIDTAYITVTQDAQDQPFEVFLSVGKAGTDTYAAAEAMGRLISLILRLDSPISRIDRARGVAEQLAGIGVSERGTVPTSLPDMIGSELLASLYIEGVEPSPERSPNPAALPIEPTSDSGLKLDKSFVQLLNMKGEYGMDDTRMQLPPDLFSATEKLADVLFQAEPIAAYERAKAHFEADEEAKVLLEGLSTAQAELRTRQMSGNYSQAEIDALRALQSEVQSSRVIREYDRAQQAAIAFLPQVNQEISQLIGLDFASLAGPANC